MPEHSLSAPRKMLVLGLVALLGGVLIYLLFRPLPSALQWLVGTMHIAPLHTHGPHLWAASIPSLLHVFGFALLTWAVLGARRELWVRVPVFWFAVNFVFETGQALLRCGGALDAPLCAWLGAGTFDVNDMIASALGAALAYFAAHWIAGTGASRSPHAHKRLARLLFAGLLVPAGVMSISGSFCLGVERNPVYLSYAELRATSVRVEPQRALTSMGKIYVYNNLLFVNTPNEGIHVYDNSDPSQPVYRAFINIPGNLDLAVKDGYLYVDSYIDLVVLDIRDVDAITVTHRIEAVFPYDAYQNIPDGISLTGTVDRSKGVVVGYADGECANENK